jgi:hypothetical protein
MYSFKIFCLAQETYLNVRSSKIDRVDKNRASNSNNKMAIALENTYDALIGSNNT